MTLIPLFGLPVGPELVLVLLLIILLFGASKIPDLARSVGKTGGMFKKGREEVEKELESDNN
jgi:sec-independent protein translocase protein TatA